VQRPPLARGQRDGAGELGVARHPARGERLRDARHVHLDDAPGAERHVADLGVPHLPRREPHRLARGLDPRHRALAAQALEAGRVRERGGVRRPAVAEPEAVEHHEHHRTLHCAALRSRPCASPITEASLQSRSSA
jgi:hypothetical protein